MTHVGQPVDASRFEPLQVQTRRHRRGHGCGAYTFEDGAGLLAMAREENAGRVLELGTAIGYTACVLASATDRTRVDTIERDPSHVALARENVGATGLTDQITVHEGDFLSVMANLQGPYDLAFFDGFGPTSDVISRLRELLKSEGVLVCANLGVADGEQRRLLEAEFGCDDRWAPSGSIEAGATRAFRKVDRSRGPAELHQSGRRLAA